MRKYGLIVLIAALLGALVWVVLFWSPRPDSARHNMLEITAPPLGGDFMLTGADGPVRLADFRGKVVLVYFGYTLCPDICPTNLAGMARAFDLLTAEEQARARGIFISVDPERDTPAKLKDYAHFFHANIIGLTGSAEDLAEIAGRYGAAYQKVAVDSALGYMIDHAAYTYLLDSEGRLRESLPHAMPPAQIAEKVRALIRAAE